MRVIGTAGHVDHGKSTLVQRLTGINPDRLKEEKQRAMTIDLGFAWMPLANNEMLGIIDVPGHRDFIENMLAGVGGIDAVILVIAADEGVMPQTREHLSIIDLLGIPTGIIALTKIDLINDPDWLELIQLDIAEITSGTRMREAPIIPVSAHTGEGVDALLHAITSMLKTLPETPDYGKPHLSIDRVFSKSGFGTVVTGTLLRGSLKVGHEVEIQPGGLRGRIRGLQSYAQPVNIAKPGSRAAVNINGIRKDDIRRGLVLTYPGFLAETRLADMHYHHLLDAEIPLKHNMEVKVFSGAAETTARVRLLSGDSVKPGEAGWIQLHFNSPLALVRGDRFILRVPSPAATVGGGTVVDAHPPRRWKRFQTTTIQHLETLLSGTPANRIAQAALSTEPLSLPDLRNRVQMESAEFDDALQEAIQMNLITTYDGTAFIATQSVNQLLASITGTLKAFHQTHPLRAGISKEELRNRAGIRQKMLGYLLDTSPEFVSIGGVVRLNTHEVNLNSEQEATVRNLMLLMNETPYMPPSYQDAADLIGEDLLLALIDLGDLVRVQSDIIFTDDAYHNLVQGVFRLIDRHGEVDTRSVRDEFNTSRKYAIGLLEYLDSQGLTRRVGDVRVAGKNRKAPPQKNKNNSH